MASSTKAGGQLLIYAPIRTDASPIVLDAVLIVTRIDPLVQTSEHHIN